MTYSKAVFSDIQWTISEHGINYYLYNGYEIYDMKSEGFKIIYQLKTNRQISDKFSIVLI